MGEDIALLKLEEPFDLDASDGCLAAVCLPKPSYPVRGNVVVSGWGTTREGGSLSTELLAVSVPVTNDVYCAIQYVQIGTLTTAYDKKTMFCAGEPFGGKDSCQGDSGGPAIQYQNGTAILVGIVSFGQGCARLTHAGVYTRVSNYVDWIEQQSMEYRVESPGQMKYLGMLFGLLIIAHSATADSCGESRHFMARIVGGRDALPGEFPWQVSLVWRGQQFCGGSLLSATEVITAAHCVTNYTLKDLDVVGGANHPAISELEDKYVQKRKVAKGFRHELFFGRYGHQKYDIGLLKLSQPFNFQKSSGRIGSICLPPKNYNVSGLVSITGFGYETEDGNMLAPVMQVATTSVLPNSTCEEAYGQRFHAESMICAADFDKGQDACKGDSGGPAIQTHRGRVVLAGIVSWGEGCGRQGRPGVYTRVSQYLDWIAAHRRLN
ncbi:trypsin-1-like [Haemaphysalis longicornis]